MSSSQHAAGVVTASGITVPQEHHSVQLSCRRGTAVKPGAASRRKQHFATLQAPFNPQSCTSSAPPNTKPGRLAQLRAAARYTWKDSGGRRSRRAPRSCMHMRGQPELCRRGGALIYKCDPLATLDSLPGCRTLLYVLARAALPKALQETPLQGLAARAAPARGRHRALHRRGRSRQSVTGSHHRVQRIKAAGPAAVQPLTRAWRGPRALGRTRAPLGVRRPNPAACSRRARSATSVVHPPSRFLLIRGHNTALLRQEQRTAEFGKPFHRAQVFENNDRRN